MSLRFITKISLLFMVCFANANNTLASEFELLTNSEYEEAVSAGDNPKFDLIPKAALGGPQIRLLSPLVTDDSLASPVDIEVRFVSGKDAAIDIDSLKIYYLMFVKKDVTKRILEHAEVGDDFVKAIGAKLPSGKHKFLLEITDTKNRMSSKKFSVKISG